MEWIDGEKKMPKPGQRVLVWHPDYECRIAYVGRSGGFYEAAHGTIADWPNVRYWMPLPEPPDEVVPALLEGEIKEGDRLIWEPNNLKAREGVTVIKVNRHDEAHALILTKGQRGEFWNDESRVREACVRDVH
jgi:hypothetical protein